MSQDIKGPLTSQLLTSGCLKFGQFTLKSGAASSYYIDLREATLHHKLFQHIVEAIKHLIVSKNHKPDEIAIVGVPYGVVPIAAVVAYELKAAYYPVRKESKGHGNTTESNLLREHKHILIEDVMSSGSSIIETIKKLEGRNVTDVIVVANREAGGDENLTAAYPSISLQSILKASDILKLHSSAQ